MIVMHILNKVGKIVKEIAANIKNWKKKIAANRNDFDHTFTSTERFLTLLVSILLILCTSYRTYFEITC